MANFDFKAATPDTSFPSGGFLFGADSQSDATPSIYSASAYLNYILGQANTWTAQNTFAAGTITSSAPTTFTQTWNAGGVTFKAIDMNVTDSASAAGSLLMDLRVGGSSIFSVKKDGLVTVGGPAAGAYIAGVGISYPSAGILSWGASADVQLVRDAADTLALRRTTNAQTFRAYNSFTDASNGEWLSYGFVSNEARVFSTANGTGTVRNLRIYGGPTAPGGIKLENGVVIIGPQLWITPSSGTSITTGNVRFVASSSGVLTLSDSAGTDFGRLQFGGTTSSFPAIKRSGAALHFRLADDSAYADIVALSVTVGSTVIGNSINAAGNVQCGATGAILVASRGGFQSPSDGVLTLRNNANDGFSHLQFGGTTSSFPALKRNSTAIDVRLADDSAYANISANGVLAGDGSAGVPTLSFSGATGVGFRRSGTTGIVFTASSADIWYSAASQMKMRSNGAYVWSSTTDPSAASDLELYRDAANILALRNSTNAQTFRVYNTWTDASNGEWLSAGYVSNEARVFSTANGTGTIRSLRVYGGPTAPGAILLSNGLVCIGPELGLSSSHSTSVSGALIRFYALSDGVLRLTNSTASDFGRLCLGGNTSSFPALKRSSANLQARLADDSAFTFTQTKLLLETAAAPSSASDTGTTGEVRWASGFVYVCVATDTWQRAAIATW